MAIFDAQQIVDKMREMFPEMYDPDIFPRIFAHQAKMAHYELILESERNGNNSGQERNTSDNHS